MKQLEWTKPPTWSQKEVYKREMRWIDYIARIIENSEDPWLANISNDEQIELSWLGFYSFVPRDNHKVSFRAACGKGDDIETCWLYLHGFGNREYAHLVSVATNGPGLYILQPPVFQQTDASDIEKAKADMKDAVVQKLINIGAPKLNTKACYTLGLIGFSLLPIKDQRAIVFQDNVVFPSPDWWDLMKNLVKDGLMHVATKLATKNQEKLDAKNAKEIARENAKLIKLQNEAQRKAEDDLLKQQLDNKRVVLNNLPIPDATTPEFQEFLKDMMFGKLKGDDPYPVYPFYIKLPEGQLMKGSQKVWDIRELLQQNANENAPDGCKSVLPYLQPHQAVVNAMLQMRSQGLITTPGLLAMHSTGAGKTLLTLCALLAFWNLDHIPSQKRHAGDNIVMSASNDIIAKPIPIFLVSVKSNQQDNSSVKLAQLGMKFFKDFEDKTVDPSSPLRFPFDVQKNPKYANVYAEIVATKHRLFLDTIFEVTHNKKQKKDGNDENDNDDDIIHKIAGRNLAEDVQKDLFELFLVHSKPYDPLKHKAVKYKVPDDAPAIYIDTAMEPSLQELVAARIDARLIKGFENAVPNKDAEKLAILKSRHRTLHTFETLGHDIHDNLYSRDNGVIRNALFVIDEAHYMNLPYNKGDKLGDAYELLKRMLQKKRDPQTTWCLAMTATPGETKEQIVALLKAVGTQALFKNVATIDTIVNSKNFVDQIRGLVSYAQLYGDFSHFARIEPYLYCFQLKNQTAYAKLYQRSLCKVATFQEQNNETMGLCHKQKAMQSLADEFDYNPSQKSKYYKYLRARSNYIMIKNANDSAIHDKKSSNNSNNVEKGREKYKRDARGKARDKAASDVSDDEEDELVMDEDNDGLPPKDESTMTLNTKDGSGSYTIYISPKLQAVLNNILNLPPGKHFVYSSDKNTIGILAKLLTKNGIHALIPKKKIHNEWVFMDDGNKGAGVGAGAGARAGTRDGPRFIMLDNIVSKKTHMKGLTYMNNNLVATGKQLAERIEVCKRRANAPENKDGSQVKVILATADHFKGVDINHLKYLHLVDAMADYQDFIQFVGRGSRYCSHKLWNRMAARKVEIFMYHLSGTAAPNDMYADPTVWNASLDRYRENWGDMESKLQMSSVDYLIFKDTIHANTRAIQASLSKSKSECLEYIPVQTKKLNTGPSKKKIKYVVDKQRMRLKAAHQRMRLGLGD